MSGMEWAGWFGLFVLALLFVGFVISTIGIRK